MTRIVESEFASSSTKHEHFATALTGVIMAASRMLFGDWRKPQDQPYSGYRYPFRLIVVFALYFAVGKLGLAIPFTSSNVSPVWPAAGVAVAAVLSWGFQVAPAIAYAAFLVNFLSPIPAVASVGIGIGNASSAVLAAYLLRRVAGFETSLPRLKDVLRFVMLAAVVATSSAASVGVTALTFMHRKAWSGFGSAWRIWWLGDAMGVLVVAPLVLTAHQLFRLCRGWRGLEFGLLSISVFVTSLLVFGPWAAVRDDVLAFVVFPFVMWAAIRFRVPGAAGTVLLVASVAVWGTARGFGPFVNHPALHNAVLLQVFIAVTALTGLMLAAVINERKHIGEAFESEQKLLWEVATANERLEERVKERTQELEQKTAELANQAKLLDLANDAIFVRNAEDKISYWNEGAERLYGWRSREVLGKSSHEVLRTQFSVPVTELIQSDRWEGELVHTRKDGSKIAVASRWTTLRDHNGKPEGWLEINTDVTARKRAEEAARSLSGRILTLQDEERRKIARELHDSLGQYLAAAKMNLDHLSASVDNKSAIAQECSEMLEKCLAETRTISHLLHPPLLDEAGFGSLASLYVEGFAQRSGIKVNFYAPPELGQLHKEVEIALFRAVQEALTNVHRHSGSSAVDIRLTLDAKRIRLEIKDNGRGIPQERMKRLNLGEVGAGVGIAGMRERIRELGGSLKIQTDRIGTRLIATIPVLERPSTDAIESGESVK